MRQARFVALALLPALALPACVTTTTTTREMGAPPPPAAWERYGRVESVRETVTRQEGNPAAGAAVGAVVGGILGSAITGHTHYDRWGRAYREGNPAGAVVGAIGGAMVGAAASQGGAEQRTYEVIVRFDDGSTQAFVSNGPPPFAIGDAVRATPQGLARY